MEQNVIVIGGNHHNTLGVIRSLGYKGIFPYVLLITENKKPYVCCSKYIKQYIVLSNANEIVCQLLTLKDIFADKPVIISCADIVTAELDSHQSLLEDYYYLPVGMGDIVQIMNKEKMSQIARDCGMLTPRNIQLNDVDFNDDRQYIIKPLKSIEGAKSDIAIVRNRMDLDDYLSSVHCRDIQIQEFVEKDIEFQLIGVSLNGGENVIIPGASIILRQPENTNTGYLKYVGFDSFDFDGYERCKDFIRTIGYSGLFSIEFLRGKDGKDYFMEINMRNDGNAICVTASGVNLPYIWYSYCLKSEEWSHESSKAVREVLVMPEFDDFVNVLKRKVSFLQWIKDVHKTDCFMEYDKSDTKPFYRGMRHQLSNYIKMGLKKIHITR